MKPIVSLSETESQSCGQGTLDGPVTARTYTRESHQKTITSSMVQTPDESKDTGSLENIVGSVQQPRQPSPSSSLAQHLSSQTQADSISAVLQHMLSQAKQQQTPPAAQFGSPQQTPLGQFSSALQRQARQPQQFHQKQTEAAVEHKQQRLYHGQHQSQQNQYQQQAQPLVHQQQYQQTEHPQQQLFHQLDHQQSQKQQQQPQSVSGKQQPALAVTQATNAQTSATGEINRLIICL